MSKFVTVLQSRKFWALATTIVALVGSWRWSGLSTQDFANGVVFAFAAYSIATGIEDNGSGV
ncbi:MAG: hypothetical protein H0Z55_00390 [Nitrosarchaeum sp.]|nr:hypothetical protein [Nitrosarchaeum sp.]